MCLGYFDVVSEVFNSVARFMLFDFYLLLVIVICVGCCFLLIWFVIAGC